MELLQFIPGGIYGLVALAVVGISVYIANYFYNKAALNQTKKKIAERQAQAKRSIDKIQQTIKDNKESVAASITSIPFSELQEKLKNGKLTCRQVLLAYQFKALELHFKTNCVTEFIHNAEERARQLDALKPEERGPLHGIPISLKETVAVAGQDCTGGLSHFIGKIHKDYGVISKVLINQGAVPFVRTNLSQAQVSYSCVNPLYGESRNPHQPKRSCGGSSGGEAALVGGNASILGIGCDMGGSIRIPAHFCGVYGFKATTVNAGNYPLADGIVAREYDS